MESVHSNNSDQIGDQIASHPNNQDEASQVNATAAKGKRKVSWVWEFADKGTRVDDNGKAYEVGICKTCHKEIKADSKVYGTSELYNAYKGVNDQNQSSNTIEPVPRMNANSSSQSSGLSHVEMRLKRKRERMEVVEINNEVDKYFSDPCEKLDGGAFDLLTWWKVNQTWYPILSMVAKDLFSIPSSTVASENAFSSGRRIVDPFRASLTPKMVEALVCTNDWLRAEEFNFYKEPIDDDISLYKELEELETSMLGAQAPSVELPSSSRPPIHP